MAETKNAVGPVIRSGELADAVIEAIYDDNPEREVTVLDRGDYVRISTDGECRLTKASLERHLGRSFPLSHLEIEMPSFAGRMKTRGEEFLWYYEKR
ncbi:MAG: MmoB/DmpM family protein [Sandaracinaceae bacterium]